MKIRNWLLTTLPKDVENYRGIPIHADWGVHSQTMELVKKYIAAGSSVLDLGAGAGAFSARLKDAGYLVTAVDVDSEKWMATEVSLLELDLDRGISAQLGQTYDAVCCLEVIEHLENPWQLLREIFRVLKTGGRLVLSTPNISSFYSRLLFFLRGEFHQFTESDLAYGHINPLTRLEIETIAQRSGFRILEAAPAGYLPVFDFSSFHLRKLLTNAGRGLAYLLAGGEKSGWVLIFVFEKS